MADAIEVANQYVKKRIGYRPGTDIDFTDPAHCRRYMQGAWGDVSADGVWTHGPLVELIFWLDAAGSKGKDLRLLVQPFLENVDRLQVRVFVDDRDQGILHFAKSDLKASAARWCQVAFRRDVNAFDSGPVRVSFQIENLPSHASLNLPETAPLLGLKFISASIVEHG
jgi:hypothetical protein